jgi:hypothetical protein
MHEARLNYKARRLTKAYLLLLDANGAPKKHLRPRLEMM